MTPAMFRSIIVLVASAATPPTAMAQDVPGRPALPRKERRQDPGQGRPFRFLQNNVILDIEEHLDEENRHLHTFMPFPQSIQDDFENMRNRFTLRRHERFFKGRPKVQSPIPYFDATLSGGSYTWSTRSPLSSRTIGNPFTEPILTRTLPLLGGLGRTGTRSRGSDDFFLGDSDPNERGESDSGFLYGPELSVPVKADLSTWEATSWAPEGSSLWVFGKAQFGEMELFGDESDLELYGIGLGIGIPIWHPDDFKLDGTLTAGVGFLRTDFGNASGFDGSLGLQGQVPISGNLGFLAAVRLNLFAGENVYGVGPTFNLGFVFAW